MKPDDTEKKQSGQVQQQGWQQPDPDAPNPHPKPVLGLQVFCAWVLFFNTWGLLNTFGEYQTYYETGTAFRASSSNISWIGSIQAFLLLFVGSFTGPLYDAGYLRHLLYVGSFMIVFGHMMLSLVDAYWQALLAQAFVIGIGAGCLFVPSVAVISQYFTTKVSSAFGIAASGSSIGGIIYPIMFHKLIPQVGFAWTVRILGFTALALLLVPCVFMKTLSLPSGKRKLVDVSAFKEVPYLLFVLGGVVGFAGLLIAFFYISYYAISVRATDYNLGFYLIPILNAASIFGRIIPNIIANKTGPLNMFVPASALSTILVFCLIPAKSLGGIMTITVLYGYFSGGYVSLLASVFVSLTPVNKRALIGTRIGMGTAVMGLGILIGAPIAGIILGSEPHLHFTSAWIFAGSLLAGATLLFVATRISMVGSKIAVKC